MVTTTSITAVSASTRSAQSTLEVARLDPVRAPARPAPRPSPATKRQEDRPAQRRADEQRAGGDRPWPATLPMHAAAEPGDDRREQRQEDDEQDGVHQPRIRLTSSTAIEPRRRKKMTRMASPIAASAGGDGQHEHREHLAGQVAEEGGERDEVDVHREQDQLDRHQHQDDVLAVEEDAEHAEHEQDRGDGEIMGRGRSQLHPLAHAGLHVLDRVLGPAARSVRRCSGRATSPRLRWVSTIAPIIATSRISPAISNGNRKRRVEQLAERHDVGLDRRPRSARPRRRPARPSTR